MGRIRNHIWGLFHRKAVKAVRRDLKIIETGKLPETPEERFRDFLTETDEKAIKKAQELNEIVDKSLNEIKEVDWKVKLEAQFEREYTGRKAIWRGNPTGLFKAWLKKKNQYDAYFEEDKKDNDFKPTGSLTLS